MKKAIIIQRMRVEKEEGFFKTRVVFDLKVPKQVGLSSNTLIFEYDIDDVKANGDAAIFSLLPVAFWTNVDIVIGDAISRSPFLQKNVGKICAVWNKLFDYKREVNIAGGRLFESGRTPSLKSGLLFSGGVDSLASYIDKSSEIEYLLFCFGADIFDFNKFNEVKKRIDDLNMVLNKKTLFYSTNIRRITDVPWGQILHACALLGPALVFSARIQKIIISSTDFQDIAENHAWGSSPLTDKYISSSNISVEHYGTHLSRLEKIKKISHYPAYLGICRVCYQESKQYNCGFCEKCLRTMVTLILLRIPANQVPFPSDAYSLDHILSCMSRLKKCKPGALAYWVEILEDVKNKKFDLSDQERLLIEQKLSDFLGDFYYEYQERHNNLKFYKKFLNRTKTRRLEAFFHLPADSLQFLNLWERFLRAKYYYLKNKIRRA
ncbi:MAG TPA: hypothetical protein P5160_03515 [Candidatus Omnitrophota bacterium]|nr:hypothetical protein [Candidatus Omnitrophota bacterium]